MSGQGEERARRLERERALVEYSSALERGDLDGVAAVLRVAETDEVLERMLLEVTEAHRADMAEAEGVPRPAEAAGGQEHKSRRTERVVARTGRGGGKMRNWIRGQKLTPGWIAGGVVAALLVVCLGGWVLSAVLGGTSASHDMATGERDGGGWNSSEAPAAAPMESEAQMSLTASYAQGPTVPRMERLIIRTGTITLEVEDTLAARQAVESLVARLAAEGGYVVSSQQQSRQEGQDPYITMLIRVPAERFSEAMDTIADLAVEVVDRTEDSDDVTEEYVDLEGRLAALEAARDRLLEIMSEAQRTEDLLQAEQQLTQREAELEAIRGRMQYLSQSAALSSISIYLQPDVLTQPVSTTWRPAETAHRAREALLDGAQNVVDFAIFFAIAVLPWLLVIALGVYLVYRLVRWLARRRRTHTA